MPHRKKAAPRRDSATTTGSDSDSQPFNVKVVVPVHHESRLDRMPFYVRYVLVVLSSLLLSSILFTVAAEYTHGDLGAVSKFVEEWWQVGGLMAWKAAELGLAWVLGFDGKDCTP